MAWYIVKHRDNFTFVVFNSAQGQLYFYLVLVFLKDLTLHIILYSDLITLTSDKNTLRTHGFLS
jgi:hypothetical protein